MGGDMSAESYKSLVRRALELLDVDRMMLAIHDVSFPSQPQEDLGRGSPYSLGGRDLVTFAAALGFTGVQLGPQGDVTLDNPSPYDSALFSRNTASISTASLVDDPLFGGLLRQGDVDASLVEGSQRAMHGQAVRESRRLLDLAYQRLCAAKEATPSAEQRALMSRLEAFEARHVGWLRRDAIFELLSTIETTELDRRLFHPAADEVERARLRCEQLLREQAHELRGYAFRQLLIHEQHDLLRVMAAEHDLEIFGDMQVGMSPRDEWAHAAALLPGYRLGAPPSRTNPEGQPWNYPVLDPAGWGEGGAARMLVRARVGKLSSEYDAVRIDHPHGFVCPWVYRADVADAHEAVRGGARLLSSPDLPDHPELARHAVARPEQLDRGVPRFDDNWVRELDEDQLGRHAQLIDVMVQCVGDNGLEPRALVCEVLSTQPYPLARVMERHGLGRFRVTQKAKLSDPEDPYRADKADPSDWIMIGTHDTLPIWSLTDEWKKSDRWQELSAYLAARLTPAGQDEQALRTAFSTLPGMLPQACLAELFVSPARNVMVFFSDLFGHREVYNRPGTFSDDNWTLRLARDYRQRYAASLATREALDLRVALALALRARGGEEREQLARRLSMLPSLPG